MHPMEDATAVEQRMLDRAGEQRSPINGSLELLPLCNMNCDMCYVRLSPEEMRERGRMRSAREWLALARQLRDAGTLFLLLTGGEPLLFPDFKTLYLELRRLGFLLTINTNATLIDEEWAAFFGQNPPRRINVTLYGADERDYETLCHFPDGFRRALRGVRLLREQGVEVKLSSSLTRANEDALERLHAIGESLGVPVRIDTYMMPAVRERGKPFAQQARLEPERAARARVRAYELEMQPKQFMEFALRALWQAAHVQPDTGPMRMSCLAASCSFTINWQGEMRPCVVMTAPAANVFELGFDAAWRQIRRETEQIAMAEKCAACPLRVVCRTCAAAALLETGRYDGVPEYLCRHTAETCRLLAEYVSRHREELARPASQTER